MVRRWCTGRGGVAGDRVADLAVGKLAKRKGLLKMLGWQMYSMHL
jgi:hypothetical protein